MTKEASREAEAIVNRILSQHALALFTLSYSKECHSLRRFLKEESINFYAVDIDEHTIYTSLYAELANRTNRKAAPFVFIRKSFVGNHTDVVALYHNGALMDMIEGRASSRYDFDVIVVGGGVGGLTLAKEATKSGKKVGLFDFVAPNAGSYWHGLGGTSINTGSIPRKLMYQAAILGDWCEDGKYFGWNFEFTKGENHDWKSMTRNIQKYIKKLKVEFQKNCNSSKVKIFNAKVLQFIDHHTMEAEDREKRKARFTAQVFVIAVGGRPKMADFTGKKYVITTDDLFSLPEKPKKTLVIGAGFVAFESAGFLNRLGVDCSVLVRSEPLKHCDSQIAEMICSHMKSIGIRFIKSSDDFEITERKPSGKRGDHNKKDDDSDINMFKYELKLKDSGSFMRIKNLKEMHFSTILLAIGRHFDVTELGLQHLGVKFNESSGKIRVNKYSRTDCDTVFAIGDVADLYIDLASIAVKSGKLLAKRMKGSEETIDLKHIPVGLCTPLECSFCGYKEEDAVKEFGVQNVVIFQNQFYPMEWAMQQRNYQRCFMKIVCLKNMNNKVIGVHILGPYAAEIIQGFAFAMKLNATKTDLEAFLGIHPTCAEIMFKMDFDILYPDQALKPTGSASSMLS